MKEKKEAKDTIQDYLFNENIPEEELTKRQWQILEAATKVFAEKGYEASRTSDIAREADIAEGTIFRYFRTKKDLLLGLLVPLITRFFRPLMLRSVEKIIANESNKTVDKVMKDIYMDRMELIKKNSPLIKTVMLESFYHPELLEPIQKQIAPNLMPIVDRFTEENIRKGTFRSLEPRAVSRVLMSTLMGYVILSNLFPEVFKGENDEKEIEKSIDILLHGILNKDGEGSRND